MAEKIGKALLLVIGILMIMSVTVFDPADLTERAKRLFGLSVAPRADRDITGLAPTTGREAAEEQENATIRNLVESLRIEETRGVIERLSTLPASRAVGYPGNLIAADYVEDQFRAIGLQGVQVQEYEVTVPVDEGGWLEVEGLGERVEVSCLWPNDVRTPTVPEGFEGALVDGDDGEFRDFNGQPMTRTVEVTERVGEREVKRKEAQADAIVLMNFDCGQRWLHAPMIGAKAIIFFDNSRPGGPPVVTRGEAEQKFVEVPANIPRFWVSREDGWRLRRLLAAARKEGRTLRARLKARMTWKPVKARNIIGFIPGTQPAERPSSSVGYKRQRVIVLSAFYDAASVVPRVAPGAESVCGLAALLQTARVLKQFPPRHTVVFLATGSHFHCLWGVQEFLRKYLPTSGELSRRVAPRGRIDFDVFVGLDLTSHGSQVATTCFGTFYNRYWEMVVYRKNLLAPYAKKFTEYAARIFRKSMSEATCPHINAITPAKKTWKNFVPRPVGFDAEAVVARGKDAVTIFTPNELRNLVDTPNDTIEAMDVEKLHTQVKTVAAIIAKAARDPEFFPDSKLHLQKRIDYSRGNVTWFDRALNPNIPKAPIGGAVVTLRHPAAAPTNAGVRTLYTAYSQPHNPNSADDHPEHYERTGRKYHEEGYYIDPITLNSRRVRINAWSRHLGEVKDAEVVVQSGNWLIRRKLVSVGGGSTATVKVAQRFVLARGPEARDELAVTLPNGEVQYGHWEPAPPELGKRTGDYIPPEQEARTADGKPDLPPEGYATIKVGNARYRGPILVPPRRYELQMDLNPPGFFVRLFRGGIEAVEQAPDEPEIDPETRIIRSLVLRGTKGTYEVKDIDVGFGRFEGQFVFPFVYFWRWGGIRLLAYKMDESGEIIYAQDEGPQGSQTYPNNVKYGGGAQCVLFRCRPMTILEIVDSRYLTVLDEVGVLGADNSVPQQWGARYIPGQSRWEGRTTSVAVVFAKYDPTTGQHDRLKVHMGTGLYGIKLLLTNAEIVRDGKPVVAPPLDPSVDLKLAEDEAKGVGYVVDGRVLLNPTYRVAWDMWVLNEYRLRELARYGIRNAMLANFPIQRASCLLKPKHVFDWQSLASKVLEAAGRAEPSPGKRLAGLLPKEARGLLERASRGERLPEADELALLKALNALLRRPDFYDQAAFASVRRGPEVKELLSERQSLAGARLERLNRLLLEAAFPDEIAPVDEVRQLGLHDRSRFALLAAREALARRDYEGFVAESRRAWGYEAKAYPDVANQADDTVKGVVFYFILLIPFAFFMERLLIGSADIRKRIFWFALIFLVVFAVLRFVHPAFKLSSSPYIILLAFVILAMGVIVLFIVVSKFNEEIRKMKQAATGIQQADVGRLSASYAAVMLGISNLRKRKIRTTLTAVTLTLLTFTVLSFTSIRKSLYLFRLSRSNTPTYEGALVRDRNWRGLQTIKLEYLRSEFGRDATIAPRAWLVSQTRGEKAFFEFTHAGSRSNVNGIVGLTPQEVYVNPRSGPQTFLIHPAGPDGRGSRWFKPGDRHVCVMPDEVAARVGITPEDIEGKTDEEKPVINMLGYDFRVIGLLSTEDLNRYKDIDDEKLTPVDTMQEAARMRVEQNPDEAAKAPIEAFTHMEAANVMFVPYEFVMDVGGTLHSIAMSVYKPQLVEKDGKKVVEARPTRDFAGFAREISKFMERVALNVFVAQGTGEEARVEVWSSIQTTSLSGVGNLFVPIIIAALIVLNTMMGAVYERFREIYIYSSVGLAPTHVAALFLAESAVFATVGAVAGYLLGQTVAGVVTHLGLLGTITLNYSSLSTIYSSVVVMLTVFLSTLYPAKKASDMAVPDVTRRWEFPPPKGDLWQFDFPFTVSGVEILGMYCYLARFLQSYGETSIGAFYTEDVRLEKGKPDEEADYVIATRCWLAPYDLGISQDVRFEAVDTGEHNIYRIVVNIHRVSGDTLSWQRMNRGFLNVLRKQFLVWRTVPTGTKLRYAEEGRQIVEQARALSEVAS